jgi:hypothetical protein
MTTLKNNVGSTIFSSDIHLIQMFAVMHMELVISTSLDFPGTYTWRLGREREACAGLHMLYLENADCRA